MTAEEIIADLKARADDLIAGAEAELGRPLDDEERDSLLDEFLSGLDEEGEETPP
jgi:F0F1-type ATP synthase membrane subunit b/b'